MAGTFVLEVSKNGKVRFSLKAGNGQIILTSEQYEVKVGAERGIESVRKNAGDDKRFTIKKAKDGSPYFVLTASNGEVIGVSQMYSSLSAMRNGMKSVMTNASGAQIVDRTKTA